MSPVLSQFVVPVTSVHKVEADGVEVFYRAAGNPSAPVLLLLHGFPASSFMFRELIPRLADQYRVIAPDLPGFGFTEVPEKRNYRYSFEALARTLEAFTDALGLNRYAIYVFDTELQRASAWQCATRNALQQSFRRTATPTKRGLVTHGDRSGNIGPLPRQKTEKFSSRTSSRSKRRDGNTRMAQRIRKR